MKRTLLLSIAVIVVVVAIIVAANWRVVSMLAIPPHEGALAESWETSNQLFRVRVDRHYEENGGFVPGAYYVFRSAPTGSDAWHDFMTFRHDDPVPIPNDQVRFVNDRIGFVFMGWMYAVTTDSGATWSVWDSNIDLPKWQCCNYRLIKDIHPEPNGEGTMTLAPIPDRGGEVPQLHTEDFGRHWSR